MLGIVPVKMSATNLNESVHLRLMLVWLPLAFNRNNDITISSLFL